MGTPTRTERILEGTANAATVKLARAHSKRSGSTIRYYAPDKRAMTSLEKRLFATLERLRLVGERRPAKPVSWRDVTHTAEAAGFALFLLDVCRVAYPMWVDSLLTGTPIWRLSDVRCWMGNRTDEQEIAKCHRLHDAVRDLIETALVRLVQRDHADLRNACAGMCALIRSGAPPHTQGPIPQKDTTPDDYVGRSPWAWPLAAYANDVVFPALGIAPAFKADAACVEWNRYARLLEPPPPAGMVYATDTRAIASCLWRQVPDSWLLFDAEARWYPRTHEDSGAQLWPMKSSAFITGPSLPARPRCLATPRATPAFWSCRTGSSTR